MTVHKFFTILIFSLIYSIKLVTCQSKKCNPKSDPCACAEINMYCENDTGLTILELPNSGPFIVQRIDNQDQEIWLRDPDKCLAEKLMSLNISSTPFEYRSKYNRYFKLFKCWGNGELGNHDVHRIGCLSTTSYAVVAAPWDATMACDQLGNEAVVLPIEYQNDTEPSNLVLTWSENSKCKPQLACPQDHSSSSSSNSKRVVIPTAIGVGLPVMVCIACCIAKIVAMRRSSSRAATRVVATTANRQPAQSTTVDVASSGLDQPTIDSFPIVIIGESGRMIKSPDQDNMCSICLSDYHPKEALKILPECLHRFHSDCIDEWLRAKAVCPICRTAPPRNPVQ